MRKLGYVCLEKYEGRYTLQLQEWNERVFKRRGIEYVVIDGETLDNSKSIVTGQVLDAHGRSYFSLTQMANLVKMLKQGEFTCEDVIYFEDMFTPGIESLPYIFDQIPKEYRPRVAVRCLAQSIDPDDFVHVWGMGKWMGLYEKMADSFVDVVLASNEEMVMHMKVAGWESKVYNISGLAFGQDEVRERVSGDLKPFDQRTMRVSFAARTDAEKQPHFYLDFIQAWHDKHKDNHPMNTVEFAIFSGSQLRGNDQRAIDRIREFESRGLIKVYENLAKNDYYALLNDTRVLFNCALQDWVSNTVSEADTLGANVLYPAYRSFPETFANDPERLYIPWSQEDAMTKLENLLESPHKNMGKISTWTDGCIDRILDILEDKGEQWNRSSIDYRKHTHESKYQ
jgi:hypothetical protein